MVYSMQVYLLFFQDSYVVLFQLHGINRGQLCGIIPGKLRGIILQESYGTFDCRKAYMALCQDSYMVLFQKSLRYIIVLYLTRTLLPVCWCQTRLCTNAIVPDQEPVKGTLTRDILAFFIIFNIKLVFLVYADDF